MKGKRYHLPEDHSEESMLCEPTPSYTHAHQNVAYPSATLVSWDDEKVDYPLGRSLEQVMEHCAEIDQHLDDPNYGIPIKVLDAEIDKMIAEWK